MQYMKPAYRNVSPYRYVFSRSLNPNPLLLLSPFRRPETFYLSPPVSCFSSSMAVPPSSLEKQFDAFRVQLEQSGTLRDRIRSVVSEIESSTRLIYATLLLVHQSGPTPGLLEKARSQVNVLKEQYKKLADVLGESPGQYHRYHGDWRSETQTVVSMLTFMHWLETGSLLDHKEAEEKLGLSSDFGLDVEDYLTGVCFMSNELPRYVVNQVTAGDYDCPRKVLKFLTDLHAAFRMLNLRNDFLRKKFDGMKYDLRKVEEVYYDVKIRGLTPNGEPVGNLEIKESKDNLLL
ncbi:hypothetical protein PHAVU_001G178300 [Phaseolus vulgaris]|uniref:Translin n=1 Tax=Phaseolus vulgaris TaxID=3885 RepID=V7D0S1_PHAVU|nr:hypothetical protein PHAVU_001G178300g [Phaseolus vulgaris]ESW34756.1 hypothetical protein PHAVU_001G178300g [Phaseolus vulgaris]